MLPPHSSLLVAIVLLSSACGTSPGEQGDSPSEGAAFGNPASPDRPGEGPSDADTDADSDTDTDTDSDTDTDTDTDADTAPDGDPGTDSGAPIRFIAIGDAGTGSGDQYAVADAVAMVCAAHGCDFALYLGDNFYNDGVSSVDDAQWQESFELPYAALEFPFYAVLGNHDYGSGGGGFEVDRANAQVEYASQSDKFVMPSTFYSHVKGNATFFGLDTTALDWGRSQEQAAWLPGALAEVRTTWTIAYGHHPYISNGDHGNANDNFGPFFEDNLCGKVDVYLCGHDHDLQWLEPTCGTEFIVSGAGAKLRDTGMGSNPTQYEQSQLGFMWVEINSGVFTGVFYDDSGNELFRQTITK
ncbi:MAG: metallophosphoesterase [Pseudomonadota bacterium]|nr:metallophosphoesterase [Pseudomonadota bacterium]